MIAVSRLLARIGKGIDIAVQKLVILLILALVAVITLQIVSRGFFTAVSWSDEISRFLLIYLSMFGAALAYNRGTHISIRLFHDKLPERGARVMDTIIHCLSLVFFILLFQYSIVLITRQRFQVSGALQLSMQYIYAAIPVSVSAMLVFCLTKITENLGILFNSGNGRTGK